jgi:hypothetical protein
MNQFIEGQFGGPPLDPSGLYENDPNDPDYNWVIPPPPGSTWVNNSYSTAGYNPNTTTVFSQPQPVSYPGRTSGGSNLNSILAVISQSLQAFGKNQSNQVVSQPGGSIGVVDNPQVQQAQAGAAAAIAAANAQGRTATGAPSPSGGGLLEQTFGSITNLIQQQPLMIAAIALGAYLLFREPPRSRR